jgi:ribonuclease E
MTDSRKDDQDRWRELHELLGLPPDEAPAAPPPPPPAPKHIEPAPLTSAEPEELASLPKAPRVFDEPRTDASVVQEEASVPPLEEEEIPPPLSDDETAPTEARMTEEDEDRPRRGRRRGRRGRRSRSRREEAPADVASLDNDDTDVEPTENELAPAPAAVDDDEEEMPAARLDDEDDEPLETFADWNVPSWQEIVASLYRPER